MDKDWRQRLQLIIDERGIAVTRVSEDAGLDRSTLQKVLNGGNISVVKFLGVCRALGIRPGEVLEGDERFSPSVPIVGYVSAGEGWTPIEGVVNEAVDVEIAKPDTIAVEVRGDSMSPVYRNGDTLICQRMFGPYVDNLIGKDCVVQTADGRNYVKILKRGSKANRVTLKSYDRLVDDIEDVAISWAAPVLWVKRG